MVTAVSIVNFCIFCIRTDLHLLFHFLPSKINLYLENKEVKVKESGKVNVNASKIIHLLGYDFML